MLHATPGLIWRARGGILWRARSPQVRTARRFAHAKPPSAMMMTKSKPPAVQICTFLHARRHSHLWAK